MTTTGQRSAVLVMGGIRNYMGKLKSLVQLGKSAFLYACCAFQFFQQRKFDVTGKR
jgi:hypothetical protein